MGTDAVRTAQPASAIEATADTTPTQQHTRSSGRQSAASNTAPSAAQRLAALARQLAADDSVPEVQPMEAVPKARARRNPSQLKKAAAPTLQTRQQVVAESAVMPAVMMTARRGQSSTPVNVNSDADDDEEDDLDWEALGKYEQLEEYLAEQQRQEAVQQARAALSSTAASSPGTTSTNQHEPSQSDVGGRHKSIRRSGSKPLVTASNDDKLRLERELDEMEKLVNFFEAFEAQDRQPSSRRTQQRTRPSQSRVAAAAVNVSEDVDALGEDELSVDDVDWSAVEQLLLGDDWEKELFDGVHGAPGHQQQDQSSPGSMTAASDSSSADVDVDDKPWADEVTTLLLGLVMISHEKYLGRCA